MARRTTAAALVAAMLAGGCAYREAVAYGAGGGEIAALRAFSAIRRGETRGGVAVVGPEGQEGAQGRVWTLSLEATDLGASAELSEILETLSEPVKLALLGAALAGPAGAGAGAVVGIARETLADDPEAQAELLGLLERLQEDPELGAALLEALRGGPAPAAP